MPQHLIVSLGNPSPEYDNTRHNLGRAAVERWLGELAAHSSQLTATRIPNFAGQIYKLSAASYRLPAIIAPDLGTYMNESGPAVAAALKFFKIPAENLLLVHDDTDLPLGALRISKDSASAGHRGVESVIKALGTKNFTRLRLGIESRANKSIPPAEDFVLQKFSSTEIPLAEDMIDRAVETINKIISESPLTIMKK